MNKYIYNKKYGIFSKEYKLVPAPNFMLRRNAIIDTVNDLPKGTVLEMGFGTGICTYEFYKLGFECNGYEIDNDSYNLANEIFNSDERIINFKNCLNDDELGMYDYVVAFEVLEHIEDDIDMLKFWKKYIKNGGRLIISVPAKQCKFSYLDKVSGHIRRYERSQLINVLQQAGFSIEKFNCYGFPFSNIFSPLFNRFYRKKQYEAVYGMSDFERTKESGRLRQTDYKYKNIIPYWFVYFFSLIQKIFYSTDLGLGYVVVAKKGQ